MEKDNILVLENGLKCEILAKVTYANQNYFFVEQLNDGDEGMENFAILKELKENNELYVVKEEKNKKKGESNEQKANINIVHIIFVDFYS